MFQPEAGFEIIIPTYNNLSILRQCLQALARQTYYNFRVWVCVDGSTDQTLDWLATATLPYQFHICMHPQGKQSGRAATRNLPVNQLIATYTLFLDSDIIPIPELLAHHLAVLTSKKCVSVGSVYYLNADQNDWAAYLQTRGRYRFACGAEIPFHYFATGNAALYTADFIEVGGFDEKFITYGGEDIDLASRLYLKLGCKFYYNAHAAGYSYMNKTVSFALNQLELFAKDNLNYLWSKYPDLPQIYNRFFFERSFWRWLINPVFDKLANLLYKYIWLPKTLKFKLLHYAVAAALKRGLAKNRCP